MKTAAMLVLAAAALIAAAPADEKSDLDRFKGSWSIDSVEVNGRKAPEESYNDQILMFEGNKYTQRQDGQVVESGTFTLDPAKTPKQIEMSIKEGPQQGQTQLGIYDFTEDNKIKVCVGQAGSKERPGDFSTKPDSGWVLFVLKKN